jgi:hypothetical protein
VSTTIIHNPHFMIKYDIKLCIIRYLGNRLGLEVMGEQFGNLIWFAMTFLGITLVAKGGVGFGRNVLLLSYLLYLLNCYA